MKLFKLLLAVSVTALIATVAVAEVAHASPVLATVGTTSLATLLPIVAFEPEGKSGSGAKGKAPPKKAAAEKPDAMEIAKSLGNDAILLLEAFVIAANTDRFRRNNQVQSLSRGFQVSQEEIRDLQARLDAKHDRQETRRTVDKEDAKEDDAKEAA